LGWVVAPPRPDALNAYGVFLVYSQYRAKPVTPPRHDERMATILDEGLETRTVQQDIADALVLIERANAKLRPGELTRPEARSLIDAYGRIGLRGCESLAKPRRRGRGRPCLRHLDGKGARGSRHRDDH